MPQTEMMEYRPKSDRIYIHFDVDAHEIHLETFIATAKSVKAVIAALNSIVFQGELEFQVVVVPPIEGSFLQKLKVTVIPTLTIMAATVVFLDSDTPSSFVRGLTGKAPSEWAYDVGLSTTTILAEAIAEDVEVDEDLTNGTFNHANPEETDVRLCQSAANMLTAMVSASLEKDAEEISSLPSDVDLDELLEARAEFYRACIFDRKIKAIGFDSSTSFPIPRSAFPERAQKPTRREPEEDGGTWHTSMEEVSVSSPNWDKEDQYVRKWKGKDVFDRTCYFVIEDDVFWELADRKHLQVGVLDKLKVQWIYQSINGRTKNRTVLRVLEINRDMLSPPLSLPSVVDILANRSARLGPEGGPTLFDDLEDWDDQPPKA